MTEPTDKVDTPDARQASMARVQTHESLLASLAPPASVEATEESKETKVDDKPKDGGEPKPKHSAQDRIRELAEKRKEAEARADAEKQRADLLEMKMKALEAQAAPIEQKPRPQRSGYASDDDYSDALADWKADQRIAERERQQAEARLQAEQREVAQQWDSRQQQAIKAIPDYAEVIGASEVIVPPYVHQALLESEKGPEIAYYLALNPDEAKRIAAMKPLAAIKRIASLETDLAEMKDDEPKAKAPAPPKQSKAPEPINPVRGAGAAVSTGTLPTDYAAFKRHREAMKRK